MLDELSTLKAEHRKFQNYLDDLDKHVSIHRKDLSLDYGFARRVIEDLMPESEQYHDHLSKEDQLFNQLNRPSGGRLLILTVIEQQRQRVDKCREEVAGLLSNIIKGVLAPRQLRVEALLRRYSKEFRAQIAFEEQVMYPVLSDLLSEHSAAS